MKNRTILILCLLAWLYTPAQAADTLRYSLQQCRDLALTSGANAKSQEETRLAAEYNRKAAIAAMFPRITANASYMWNSRDAHLLANSTDFSFGTATVNPDGTSSFTWSGESSLGQMADAAQGTPLEQPIRDLEADAGQHIADAYRQVYDKLTLDLTHLVVAHVGITQPIYTGGRLTQMYKIAKATENMAVIESEAKHDEIIYGVDEAYWRVVSVSKKKALAEQYYRLLCQLEDDVKAALDEGLVTQADLLKVTTKRGEAEVKKLQAENGLTLSNMALAQVCGLPLNSAFVLDESGLTETYLPSDSIHTEEAVANRTELQLLQQAEQIAKSNAMMMAAGLQPNIVASAGYIYTIENTSGSSQLASSETAEMRIPPVS